MGSKNKRLRHRILAQKIPKLTKKDLYVEEIISAKTVSKKTNSARRKAPARALTKTPVPQPVQEDPDFEDDLDFVSDANATKIFEQRFDGQKLDSDTMTQVVRFQNLISNNNLKALNTLVYKYVAENYVP